MVKEQRQVKNSLLLRVETLKEATKCRSIGDENSSKEGSNLGDEKVQKDCINTIKKTFPHNHIWEGIDSYLKGFQK